MGIQNRKNVIFDVEEGKLIKFNREFKKFKS